VTELTAVQSPRRPLVDGTLTFELSPVIHAPVTLSTSFGEDSELLKEVASLPAVSLDIPVDGRNADGELIHHGEDTGDLLRTPLLTKKHLYLGPLRLGELGASVALMVSGNGIRMGDNGRITSRRSEIALSFPIEGAWMPA
jgi:hypothetical protein